MKRQKIRIVHIINSFTFGGAEAMLVNLLLRTDRDRFEPQCVSLIDDLRIAGSVMKADIPVEVIGMKAGIPDPKGLIRLAQHLRRVRPDMIQTWMDHSNLIGGIAARMATRTPVVWGIHHSDHAMSKRSTKITVGACARLSRYLPASVALCSEHSRKLYALQGFAPEKLKVIPNGFDTDRFRPDPAARARIRYELGISQDTPLIGLAARWDPIKDHANFLRAAAQLIQSNPKVRFLLCGDKVDAANSVLMSLIQELGIGHRCHLLGARRDVPSIYAAIDIATSSSLSEAFPLVLGEAMACGTPCVATDVGDSAIIVGSTGKIVPPGNSPSLAGAWNELLNLSPDDRHRLSLSARRRVCDLFELTAVTRQYEDLYLKLLTPKKVARIEKDRPAMALYPREARPSHELRPMELRPRELRAADARPVLAAS